MNTRKVEQAVAVYARIQSLRTQADIDEETLGGMVSRLSDTEIVEYVRRTSKPRKDQNLGDDLQRANPYTQELSDARSVLSVHNRG